MSDMIKHIAVIGSGLTLAMTTAILANSLRASKVNILALELPSQSTQSQSHIESCGPEFSALCGLLGVNETDLISTCEGTFRLGNRYTSGNQDWFVPFAHMGMSAEQDDFEQALFQHLKTQNNPCLGAYSAASAAALAGKFAIAGAKRPDLRKALDYGVHLEQNKYCTFIKSLCKQPSVRWVNLSNNSIKIERNQQDHIKRIHLDGQDFSADFWFDLSQEGLLIKQKSPQLLESDIAITHMAEWQDASINLQAPYTRLYKLEGAWLKTNPLRKHTVYQVFANNQQIDLEHIAKQIEDLGYISQEALSWTAIVPSKLAQPWQGNCLLLGNQSVQLAGMLFSELQCVQAALVQFLDLFPNLHIGEKNRAHYNKVWQHFVNDAQDYTAAHFIHSVDTFDNMHQSLKTRLQVFKRLGRLEPMNSDAVSESQWYHLLFGLGLRPELSSVVLSTISADDINKKIEKVSLTISQLVKGMPPHEQYLNRFYPISSN